MTIERLETLSLYSDYIALTAIPELGGRLTSLRDRRTGREWLWTNAYVPIRKSPLGADYDSRWMGGFEELFPNDATTILKNGMTLPDHGELWSMEWQVDEANGDTIALSVNTPITESVISKRIQIQGPTVHIRYRLENPTAAAIHHLFKLHPAIAVNEKCRLEMPGGHVEQVDPAFGNMLGSLNHVRWPGPVDADLSICYPPESMAREFVYVTDLPEGWCGVRDDGAGARLRFDFPLDVFPYCWLFLTYGGWHGHNVVVLEPCTNYPKDLDQAIGSGTSAVLPAGEIREFEVSMSLESL